jgi:hypothetical protein
MPLEHEEVDELISAANRTRIEIVRLKRQETKFWKREEALRFELRAAEKALLQATPKTIASRALEWKDAKTLYEVHMAKKPNPPSWDLEEEWREKRQKATDAALTYFGLDTRISFEDV